MSKFAVRCAMVVLACAVPPLVFADADPRKERHELMEGVGDAAKPVGGMLKGEAAFDNAKLMESLQTFLDASNHLGALFPPGSEGGDKSRAAPAIWSDREGFDAALKKFHDAVEAAIAANPQSLDDARPAVGPVFNACKNCHDTYRLEKD
jgi:cytochrome c556